MALLALGAVACYSVALYLLRGIGYLGSAPGGITGRAAEPAGDVRLYGGPDPGGHLGPARRRQRLHADHVASPGHAEEREDTSDVALATASPSPVRTRAHTRSVRNSRTALATSGALDTAWTRVTNDLPGSVRAFLPLGQEPFRDAGAVEFAAPGLDLRPRAGPRAGQAGNEDAGLIARRVDERGLDARAPGHLPDRRRV